MIKTLKPTLFTIIFCQKKWKKNEKLYQFFKSKLKMTKSPYSIMQHPKKAYGLVWNAYF